jgi:diguanylate cyclase (GGDEF)-like protein/PAS domain S-box-containing protein
MADRKRSKNKDFDQLRTEAEKRLRERTDKTDELSMQEMERLVHELGTHQIELEIQNEELRRAQLELDQSRRKYSDLYDFAPVGYLTIDRDGTILDANYTFSLMLNMPKRSLHGKKFTDFIPRQEWRIFYSHLEEAFRNRIKQVCEVTLRRRHGNEFVIQLQSITSDEEGITGNAMTAVIDINERKIAESALKESEERYRVVAENALDAIFTIDEESRIVLVNSAAESIFGYSTAEMQGKSFTMLMPERLRQAHLEAVKRHVSTGKRQLPWGTIELPGLHRDGREIPLEISYGEFLKNGKYYFIGIVRDITRRKEAEETIRHQIFYDQLTGLPNRAQIMMLLDHELSEKDADSKKIAILHIDLDRFKIINDSLGHEVGDKLLIEVAERLKFCVRKGCTLGRIGGDEYVILANIGRANDASAFAREIVAAMRDPFIIDSRTLYVTVSIGISMYPEDSRNPEILLKNADIAMSHIKERGGNNFHFFNPALNTRTVERLLLESSLRQTIEKSELVIYYQPLVNIGTGEITCLEALVRWRHEDLGLLLPAQFIPAAEETGFISNIDEWVLRTVCSQIRDWKEAGYPDVCVSVNLSAQRFQQATLVEDVSGIINEDGLDPSCLNIEVTEGTAMRDIDLAVPNLNGLHDLGIDVSIDDFGTGYSSLNYLKRLPVHKLKIDKSFISGVEADADDQSIVKAVIAMGHSLKLKIIAEGVETNEQLAFLRANNCDEMQGFLFSKPLPPDEVEKLFAKSL